MFGLPHSGKSSLAQKLVSEHGFIHINLGAIIRKKLDNSETKEYAELNLAVSEGKMLSSKYILNIVRNELNERKSKDVIFDGFPRNEEARNDFEELSLQNSWQKEKIKLLNFIISTQCSLEFQVKRNRNHGKSISAIRNRVSIYYQEECQVIKKMKTKYDCIDLTWENGEVDNYKLVEEELIGKRV